jgi:hypothetical protein
LSAGVDGHDGRLDTTESRENVRQIEPTELAVDRLVGDRDGALGVGGCSRFGTT